MLQVEAIDTFYGTSQALFEVTLQVLEGEAVCLLGRNGAGKSTLLQSIVGLLPPRQGRILFRGQDITGLPPHRICRCGIGFVPENRRLFGSLTGRENLEVGWRPETDEPKSAVYERVLEMFPSLRGLLHRKAGTLSGGEQQMLAIARTLMGSPTCLLLDEPAEGLAPMVVEALQDRLMALKQAGYTLLVAAQSLPFVSTLADRAYILATGRVHYAGSLAALLADEEAVQTYLGV